MCKTLFSLGFHEPVHECSVRSSSKKLEEDRVWATFQQCTNFAVGVHHTGITKGQSPWSSFFLATDMANLSLALGLFQQQLLSGWQKL